MLRPTNDPIATFRRQQAAAARATREAASAGGTQPFQSVEKLKQQIEDLRALVVRMPQVSAAERVESGFGLSDVAASAWKTVATITVPSLPAMSRVVVSAGAQGTVLDRLTGGLTTSTCRILINGVASAVIPAAKDAGASVVQNVLTVSTVREIAPLPASVTVQFQMATLRPDAYPADETNLANLTVYAAYSAV